MVQASSKDANWACPVGRGPQEDPGLAGEIISQHWPRNASGAPPSELVNVALEREVWGPLLKLLPQRPNNAHDNAPT